MPTCGHTQCGVPCVFYCSSLNKPCSRQVSALNPALRIPPNVMPHAKKRLRHLTIDCSLFVSIIF